MWEKHLGWLGVVAGAVLWLGVPQTLRSQVYQPGVTYFGRSNYIEYTAGDLPIIFSAPHGGALQPAELPNRTYGTFATDSNTEDLVRRVRTEIQNRVGHIPHIIICRLDRDKIDCNREIVEGAQGNPNTEIAWNEFQNFIIASRTNAVARHGRGFYADLHGHGHTVQRLELGYLLTASELRFSDTTLNSSATYENKSSIRSLSQLSPLTFSQVLRGSSSFGGLIQAQGYPATPSPADPAPAVGEEYFNGGYNTVQHGSSSGGTIDGLQIECHSTGVRDTAANRTAFAQALAATLEHFFAAHYNISLRECVPSIWPGGGGSWATAGNWAGSVLPVSTNHLLFAGAGGTVTHNLSALTTGSGVVAAVNFSNSVTSAYTITGNAFTLLRGITNLSTFTQVISNAITTLGSPTVAATTSPITFGGNITNQGQLRVIGDVNANGIISGNGNLTKTGSGRLTLTAVNSYAGATTNQSGTISLNATATFGDGNGLLVLAGGEVLSLNTRSGAPISNPVLMTASSTISGNGTLTNSLRILPFSANNISGTAGTLTIRHSGSNAFASNNVFRVRLTGGGFDFTRPVVVGFVGDLDSTVTQLESYNDNLVGDQTFSSTISGIGQLRRDAANPAAAGRTILTGVNSYSGGTIVIAGTLLVNNPFGSGTGSGLVAVSNNATLGGSGTISGPVWCVGNLAPGASVGSLTFEGGLDLSGGGTNVWELGDLTTLGEGVNYDQTVLTAGELVLGSNSRLSLSFINAATSPSAAHPFWLTSHVWKIVSLTGTATNPGQSSFGGILNDTYASGSFTNYADAAGNVFLAYVAATALPPVVESFALDANGKFSVAYAAETNRTCILQYTTSLSAPAWVNVSTNILAAGTVTVTNATAGDPMRFYRVLVVP